MNETLKSIIEAKLKAREKKGQLRQLTIFENENLADFSSNDYLSLSSDGEFYRRYLDQLQQQQVSHGRAREMAMGSGGSRLLDGNSARAEKLERETLPRFHRARDGLLFGSGFDANVGVYSTLAQPGDIIVYDELVHASVHDGMRLARAARCFPFAHNDATALQATLAAIKANHKATTGEEFRGQVFVGIETVYSMDGDVAPLRALLRALRAEFPCTGHLIVDEAHATGVVGPGGRGLVCALGLENEVLVRVHTFGKGVGAAGAVVLCDSLLRKYFINYCRPFVYSTAMPGYALAAIEAAYAVLDSPTIAAPRLARLWALMHRFHTGLSALSGAAAPGGVRAIYYAAASSGAPPASAIFAVQTPAARALATHCRHAARCLVRPIVYPTVPRGGERVRVCLHAGNTDAEVDALLQALKTWTEGVELDKIKQDQHKPRL
jgi:8-amino-7-oxononanoate synthase